MTFSKEKLKARKKRHYEKRKSYHNHQTGKVRGLLCGHCNRALGYLREDLSLLPKIQAYLEKYETPTT